MTALVGIDWGTTSFRAYRLAADGGVLERRVAAAGILSVEPGGFPDALRREVGDWLEAAGSGVPVLLSGMIGSRQGWREAPYATCPAGLDDIASALAVVEAPGLPAIRIVPGLSLRSPDGVPDVMRGEETQLFGLDLGAGRHTVCLPGTHSKWATVADGRIEGFATAMTGEVFAVLRGHSILGRLMPAPNGAPAAFDTAAFDRGLAAAARPGGLLHHLFAVRAHGLFGDLDAPALPDYLSGLLIGHEVRALGRTDGPVHLVGSVALCDRYARALPGAIRHGEDAAAAGLHRIARTAGLLP